VSTTHGTPSTAGAPGGQAAGWWPAGRRRWLGAAAVILAVGCLAPPVGSLAGRYVVAETAQFAVFAMVVPALLVLAAPWPLLRLARRDPADREGLADRLATARRRRPSFLRSVGFLAAFAGCVAFWRLPPVIDALARYPALAVAELATLLAAGPALWLELVPSRPLRPRGRGVHVAVVAAAAMWVIWIIAYILGLATRGVFHAYHYLPGGPLSAVADQELATAVLWGVAAVCFLPVVFTSAVSWLHEGEDVDAELGRAASGSALPPVRGWGHPRRGRARSV
jgi:cytochrome c oxidase assembly factor CtaG